jgi:hypothetical protein
MTSLVSKPPEYFVSFCLAQESELDEFDAISALGAYCGRHLQYWEIVYVAGESHHTAIRAASDKFAAIKSLRIILVRDGASYYRRRTIAASEAIGDVVVLTSFAEMSKVDLMAFAEEAMSSRRIVIGRRARKSLFQPMSYWLVGMLSRYRVDGRDLKTIALPRDRLVAILARPTAPIELRFEPKRGIVPYMRKELPLHRAGGEANLKERLELLAEIISTSAARFLSVFALASAAVSVTSVSYGIYAVAVSLMQDDVQPGWFSTAIAQSGTAAFLSLGLAVIALGLANIAGQLDGGVRHEIIEEIGNISFYDRVHDLNIEIGTEPPKVDVK